MSLGYVNIECRKTSTHYKLKIINCQSSEDFKTVLAIIKQIPSIRFNPTDKTWRTPIKNKYHVDKALKKIRGEKEQDEEYPEKINMLLPYQLKAVKVGRKHDRYFYFMEMRLGKTPISLLSLKNNKRVFVVTPASLLHQWHDEIKFWRPDYSPYIVKSFEDYREPDYGEICILSYTMIQKVELQNWDGLAFILDEIHKAKSSKTNTFKKLIKLIEASEQAYGLTGTPILRDPYDMWCIFRLFNLHKRAFTSFENYMDLFHAYKNDFGKIIWNKPRPEVFYMVRKYATILYWKDVYNPQDMPQIHEQTIMVDVDEEIAKQLDELLDEWDNHLKQKFWNVSAHKDELPPFECFSEMRATLAKVKEKKMLEIVEEYEQRGEPIIVFCSYLSPIEKLKPREAWKCITGKINKKERRKIQQEFQEGKLKGIGLTIGAGNVGLDLSLSNTVLFVDLAWNPADNKQALYRFLTIKDKNQHKHVKYLIADHSLDIRLMKILKRKTLYMQALESI